MAAAKWTNSIWPEHVLNSWLLSNSIMHSNNSVSCAWQFAFIWKFWWRGLNLCGNWQKSRNALTVLSRALRQWQVTSHKRTEFSVCFVFEKTTYMIASSSEKSRLGRCQERARTDSFSQVQRRSEGWRSVYSEIPCTRQSSSIQLYQQKIFKTII